MARLHRDGITRCRCCGAHLEQSGDLTYCINRRCRARNFAFPWNLELAYRRDVARGAILREFGHLASLYGIVR